MAIKYTKEDFFEDVRTRLGSGMVDVELDNKHIDLAFRRSLMRYRQRSDNAMEESFVFMDVQPGQSVYTMPDEVAEVRAIYRSGIGQAGSAVDPFSLAATNSMYFMMNPSGMGGGGAGTLATYDIAMGFQKLAQRMFGYYVLYTWNASTKKLRFERQFYAEESMIIHVWNTKPEEVLLTDPYASIWLLDYCVASSKVILGEARSKFQSLAGPSGGVTLNGEAMKTEGEAEMVRLDLELTQFVDGHAGLPFIIG